ncbi:MAG TPA: DUF58 domain-containing protein [Burkholderiales bacterium]|nr:DUF58 domain-containing protein [Burkholderiales bacterium]
MRRPIYLALRVFSALDHWLRERLTAAGWLALGAAGAAGAAGLDTTQNTSYQAATLLGALLLLAWGASLLFRASVAVSRELPRYATAGEPFSYAVAVENQGPRALAGLTLRERLADPRPRYDEWRRAREPGEERRNWFDRNVGYFRWRWLIERRTPQPPRESPLPELAPGARRALRLTLTPRRRGRIELAGLVLGRTDPLGLVRGLAPLPLAAHITALPRRYHLPRLALPGRRRHQPGGVSLASSVGDSEEFLALREYRPGDPLQHIHWKSFARTGRPIVKEFQDEFFERHALVLDTGTLRGEDSAFEDAVAVAASFVYTIDTQECLLDLLFVGGEVRHYVAGRGQLQSEHMLEVLAGVGPSAPQGFDALSRAVLEARTQLASCILVLVSWDDARRRLAESLAASGTEVRAILVCASEDKPRDAPAWLTAVHPGAIEAGLAGLERRVLR